MRRAVAEAGTKKDEKDTEKEEKEGETKEERQTDCCVQDEWCCTVDGRQLIPNSYAQCSKQTLLFRRAVGVSIVIVGAVCRC